MGLIGVTGQFRCVATRSATAWRRCGHQDFGHQQQLAARSVPDLSDPQDAHNRPSASASRPRDMPPEPGYRGTTRRDGQTVQALRSTSLAARSALYMRLRWAQRHLEVGMAGLESARHRFNDRCPAFRKYWRFCDVFRRSQHAPFFGWGWDVRSGGQLSLGLVILQCFCHSVKLTSAQGRLRGRCTGGKAQPTR